MNKGAASANEFYNRMRPIKHYEFINPFYSVRKVYVDETEFEVSGSQSRCLNPQDWESILQLSEFLCNGGQAKGIDYQSLGSLFLTKKSSI